MSEPMLEPTIETVFAMAQEGSVHIFTHHDDYLASNVTELTIESGGEDLTILLDAFHMRELRLALARAEKFLKP